MLKDQNLKMLDKHYAVLTPEMAQEKIDDYYKSNPIDEKQRRQVEKEMIRAAISFSRDLKL